MNILFVNSSRGWGGGGGWLMQIWRGLISLGHQVVVACRRDSALANNLSGSEVELIPLRSWGDFSPDSIWRLIRIIKTKQIDLVCTNWEKDLRLGGIAAWCAGVPVGPSREVALPIKDTWLNRFFYRTIASAILVNSFATYSTLLNSARWLNRKQVRVIWKGTESGSCKSAAPADLKNEFHLSEGDVIAGFVGRLDEQKGVPTLLEAMRLAVKREPRLRLVFVGEGNLQGAIETF